MNQLLVASLLFRLLRFTVTFYIVPWFLNEERHSHPLHVALVRNILNSASVLGIPLTHMWYLCMITTWRLYENNSEWIFGFPRSNEIQQCYVIDANPKGKLRHVMKGMNDQLLPDQDMEAATRKQYVSHRDVGTRPHPPLLHFLVLKWWEWQWTQRWWNMHWNWNLLR